MSRAASETAKRKSPVPSDMSESLIGRTVGDFVLREIIGRGGFGAVYRAEQTRLGREAAVKVLHSDLRGEELFVQRFLREAKLASSLDHPFAAHIYAFGVEPDGLLWIAMEYVHGTPLERYLSMQGPLPLARLVPFIERLCEVVESAHVQGIVHRDLKPTNIMVLSRVGRLLPKLLDLGLAKVLYRVDEHLSPDAPTPKVAALGGAHSQLGLSANAELTRHDALGSPHYMSPEQWLRPNEVDARSDIYAIGVLTYQCLSGKLPFEGSLPMLAAAHASQPVPLLGPSFPAAVQAAIERAMAKKPEDRFGSATEFASALRQACGVEDAGQHLPQLEEDLRQGFLSSGPQPLAEGVALLEAARATPAALEKAQQLAELCAHFVGTLALSARAAIGPGGPQDTPEVVGVLTRLRSGSLSPADWLTLAEELGRPFARLRDAYPVPELLGFLFRPDGDEPTEAARVLAGMVRRAEDKSLEGQLAHLSVVLRALLFLLEYPLHVAGRRVAEKHVGVRRPVHLSVPMPVPVEEGRPFLASADGIPLLTLWPFAQALLPSPGASSELFLLAGDGRHGARLLSSQGFERHDPDLWAWFDRSVGAFFPDTTTGSWVEAAPYLGLSTFGREQSGYFFGREKEAEAFANRLRINPLLAVVGPSGVGKSSFVQAGVAPLLPKGWRVVTTRPGRTPLATLEANLVKAGFAVAGLAEQLRQSPKRLKEVLLQQVTVQRSQELSSATDRGILLVVDQFEELVTLCRDPKERDVFAEALMEAGREFEGPVRFVLTLRDDFLIRIQSIAAMKEHLTQSLHLLTTPAPSELRRILVEPAKRVGFEFEDTELPDEMVKAVAELPGALALLSFTASKLWELRDRGSKRLTRKAYGVLGGVGGALAHHAEEMMAGLGEAETGLVREAFRHLVTAEGTRAVLTRDELIQVLGGGRKADEVLERLVGARLLVAAEGPHGETRVEVIHEALLSSWPRLVSWRWEDAESARLRDQLRAAARQWVERGRPKGLLWRAEALLEYRVWRSRFAGALTDTERAFGEASESEETRAKRLRTAVLAGIMVGLAVGVVALYRSSVRAEQAADRAEKAAQESKTRLIRLYVEQGRQLVLNRDPLRAFPYLERALSLGEDTSTVRFLLARAKEALSREKATLVGHQGYVVGTSFSSDGRRVATSGSDMTARLWEANGTPVAVLSGHQKLVSAVFFCCDNRRVLTHSLDDTARAWNMSGQEERRFDGIRSGVVTPDGRYWLQTRKVGGTVQVVELSTLKVVDELRGLGGEAQFIALSPNGRLVAANDAQGYVRVWDFATRRPLAKFRQRSSVRSLAVGDNGRLVVSADDNAQYMPTGQFISAHDVTTGRLLWKLTEPSGQVKGMGLSPDGALVAVAGNAPAVTVYRSGSGEVAYLLHGHAEPVNYATFSPDGRWLATGDDQGVTRLWDARSGSRVLSLVGHSSGVWRSTFSPDGESLVTGSFDQTARVWNAAPENNVVAPTWTSEPRMVTYVPGDSPRLMAGLAEGLAVVNVKTLQMHGYPGLGQDTVAASPTGKFLASSSPEELTVYAAQTMAPLWTKSLPGTSAIEISSDDAHLAAGSSAGRVQVFELKDGREVASFKVQDPISRMLFRPGDELVVLGEHGLVKAWNIRTGAVRDLPGAGEDIYNGAISPDGALLVFGGASKVGTVVQLASGAPSASLEGLGQFVRGAAFDPTGQYAVLAGHAGAVGVWDVRSGALLSQFSADGDLLHASVEGSTVHLVSRAGRLFTFSASTDPSPLDQVSSYLRCRIPFTVEDEELVRRTPVCSGK